MSEVTSLPTQQQGVQRRELAEQPTAVRCGRVEVADIAGWIGPAFGQVMAAMSAEGLLPAGPPFARYTRVEGLPTTFDIEAGFPCAQPITERAGAAVRPSSLPGGAVAVVVHVGPYDAMTSTYQDLEQWVAEHDLVADGAPWECYLTEPAGNPAGWRTEIVQPCRPAD